jgi:multidrug efflux pump
MFGMVLVIGIVVDDAIVVVENVERIMSEEGLPPLEATRKAMGQISGAIIGVTVVLISVFVPLAFFSGSVGNIYRQFAAVMGVSIAFSAFMALSLTPALCATLLKPVEAGHHHAKTGFFGWFNRGFSRTAKGYEGVVARILPRAARYLVIYVAIVAGVAVVYLRLPTSFLPNEDQGNLLVNVQLPPGRHAGARAGRDAAGRRLHAQAARGAKHGGVLGFSFSGQGQNAALAFVTLKDWAERTRPAVRRRRWPGAPSAADGHPRCVHLPAEPAADPELGASSGFAFRLQDRAGLGHDALLAARNQLLGCRLQEPNPDAGAPGRPGRCAAAAARHRPRQGQRAGRGFRRHQRRDLHRAGLGYVNDFPNAGRLQRVVVQADAPARMQPDDLLRLTWPTTRGRRCRCRPSPARAGSPGRCRPCATTATRRCASAAARRPGQSTGAAMAEMERLAAQLPQGFGFEWTGLSREEKLAGSQAIVLYAFAILSVFLCLAALYESWSIPLAVILVVPLGVLGVLLATLTRGYANDVYFQVGLITIIGLSAKNAILIIEFAKDLQAQGKGVIEAALAAAHLRFRPIVMTSMAFTSACCRWPFPRVPARPASVPSAPA